VKKVLFIEVRTRGFVKENDTDNEFVPTKN